MRISHDSGRKLVNVNKRDFVVKFKFRNYATITVRVSRLRSREGERERERERENLVSFGLAG